MIFDSRVLLRSRGVKRKADRKALERLLDLDAAVEDRLDAWWYLSEISEDKKLIRGIP